VSGGRGAGNDGPSECLELCGHDGARRPSPPTGHLTLRPFRCGPTAPRVAALGPFCAVHPLSSRDQVEVLGRYSNHADQGKRIKRVLETPLSGLATPVSVAIREIHRRLQTEELEELAQAYLAGATLAQLSDRFRQHRSTIATELERRGVPRRYRLVKGERLDLAIQSYQDGNSVVTIGKEFGVAGETVRKALIQAGVKLRPRRGTTS
jgi:hypothetical protein